MNLEDAAARDDGSEEYEQFSRAMFAFEERIEDFYETMVRVEESYLKKKSENKDKKKDVDQILKKDELVDIFSKDKPEEQKDSNQKPVDNVSEGADIQMLDESVDIPADKKDDQQNPSVAEDQSEKAKDQQASSLLDDTAKQANENAEKAQPAEAKDASEPKGTEKSEADDAEMTVPEGEPAEEGTSLL